MRVLTPLRALSAAAALAILAGCSGNSSVAPKPSGEQGRVHALIGRIPVALGTLAMLKINLNAGHHITSFDRCPASGNIEYVSDYSNNVVNIYKGNFAGQAPCGQLSPGGMSNPQGMFVEQSTHNLYVANTGGHNILVFHRGARTPFRKYTDPGVQNPDDVTVTRDGTVIAANIFQANFNEAGSISTWHIGGAFVGNFPMPNSFEGLYLTVQKDGTLYYNDIDMTSDAGLLWTGSCPNGACGTFTSTGATTTFPGGLRSADGEDVVQIDQNASGGGALITYESFPNGVSCAIGGGDPDAMDINRTQKHVFYADALNDVGGEISYPSCAPIGTVPGNSGGLPIGAAVDAPASL
jgi:DNA-binding beta-propeller fold protein YncE